MNVTQSIKYENEKIDLLFERVEKDIEERLNRITNDLVGRFSIALIDKVNKAIEKVKNEKLEALANAYEYKSREVVDKTIEKITKEFNRKINFQELEALVLMKVKKQIGNTKVKIEVK